MILDDIIRNKKEELADVKRRFSIADIKSKANDAEPARGFGKALAAAGGTKLIAEVKKASPTQGVIRQDFDPVSIARIYEGSGATCISVLTEQKYFQGRLEYLAAIRQTASLPLLRKDFIIDEYQIYEAKAAGADAILLIATSLEKQQIEDFLGLAGLLSLDVLIESHTYKDLDKSLQSGALIIGINNRDLTTFTVNFQRTLDLMKDIPDDRIVVSESGIKTRNDVTTLEKSGVDAILVGETLMREPNIEKKVKELLGL